MQVKRPTEEQIRSRAYELYLERGCQHGHDRNDWLQAEQELLQPSKPDKGRASKKSL
jgi:hypothetical protein